MERDVVQSLLRIALGVALTLVVVVLALVPPIIHFVTGPISPGIGGFIAGRQFRLSDREAAVMGVVLALVAGVPAYLLIDSVLGGGFAIPVAAVAALWSGGLATVAAWVAGSGEEAARRGG